MVLMKKMIIMFMLNDKEDGDYRHNVDLGYFCVVETCLGAKDRQPFSSAPL